jgi:hypothetical protein
MATSSKIQVETRKHKEENKWTSHPRQSFGHDDAWEEYSFGNV